MVGGRDEGVGGGVLGTVVARRDSGAHGHADDSVLERDLERLDPLSHALREQEGARRIFAQEKDELLAAVTRDDVFAADLLGRARRHRAEDLIAGGVAVSIVDGLEVIDVEDDNAKIRAVTVGVRKLGVAALVEVFCV